MENKKRVGRPSLNENCTNIRILSSDLKVLKRLLGELDADNLKDGFHTVLLNYVMASGFIKEEVEGNE